MQTRRGSSVGIALTREAFRMAERQHVVLIEPNVSAMAAIARFLKIIGPNEPLPSQMLVVRASERLCGEQPWDDILPRNLKPRAREVRDYRFAAFAGDKTVADFTRDQVVGAARAVGARALTEVSIPDWQASRQVYATAYAKGLLQGQRPLDLLPEGMAPTLPDMDRVQRGVVMPDAEDLRMLDYISKSPRVPNPFYIAAR
ncbi:MAG TPA: hypothetical protein VLG11_04535 [Candidatus Saccharimonadales bacterium]|nr:hypothetical protein [Candidatus Saccharimonadales bacterium]